MKISITAIDDNNQTATWTGTSADDFDKWTAKIGSAYLNNDAHELIDRTIDSVGDHYDDIKAAKK